MSSIPLRSPTQPRGFQPLNDHSYSNMEQFRSNDIPLESVRTNSSSTKVRKEGRTSGELSKQGTFPYDGQDGEKTPGSGFMGRRIKKSNTKRVAKDGEEVSVTGLGRLYYKIVNFSVVTRYLVYVLPVGILIAVPIVVGATVESAKEAKIGGVKILWFFTWIEVVWLSIWVAKVIAMSIPGVFIFLCGVVSSGTRKYALVIKNLEIPISLVLWAATGLATFEALTTAAPGNDSPAQGWIDTMKHILGPLLISACIYLGEKTIVQLISVSYHQRSFSGRIQESKRLVHLVGLLYDASRTLFPMYCHEFEEEDIIINNSIETMLVKASGNSKHLSGAATPMKFIGDVARLGDKVTSVFGNIASEISGKQVFNPHAAHSIVVEALEKKSCSEALAKRLWMSFVVEGKESLYPEDIREVLGPARQEEADEAFAALDADGNGDISLDEMIVKIVEIGRDRKAIASSMKDISQAINVLDQVMIVLVLIVSILVFVAFLNQSFVSTLATAGTTLISLSFVFAVTTQEFLGSCIFLFVKHPFDVGDRVDIVGPEVKTMVVEQISLLYTIFKRIDNMKMVQVPNIVLNGLWVENLTRSKAMKEQLEMFISFDTSLEDIDLLRKEMEAFVRHPDNSRDFLPDIILECTGIGEMNKLQLKVEIRHKSNWSNETVRASRRSKFMCALVLALRKVPIYAPGGGGLPLGDPGNPSYSVAVSNEIATASRDEYTKKKEGKRLVPTPSSATSRSGKSSGLELKRGNLGSLSETAAAKDLNARRPTEDSGRDDSGGYRDDGQKGGSREESLERVRSNDIEDLRQGLLKRESTRGRRRPGERLPPVATGPSGPGFSITNPSPRREGTFDEEAGIESRMFEGNQYGSTAPNLGTGSFGAPSSSTSYSMFPPAGRQPAQGAGLSHHPTAPAATQGTGRARGLSSSNGRSPPRRM